MTWIGNFIQDLTWPHFKYIPKCDSNIQKTPLSTGCLCWSAGGWEDFDNPRKPNHQDPGRVLLFKVNRKSVAEFIHSRIFLGASKDLEWRQFASLSDSGFSDIDRDAGVLMGFVIWKILDQLNVGLFNVKQGFCLSRKLLLFGVVPIFLTFSKFQDFSGCFHYYTRYGR